MTPAWSAWSAHRPAPRCIRWRGPGIAAWAVDLFADRDLTRVAPMRRLSVRVATPTRSPRSRSRFPPGPVLYTGGLENHPRVIAELAASRELWGNSPEVLERVRDPHALSASCADNGARLSARRCRPASPAPHRAAGCASRGARPAAQGIRFARPGEAPSTRHYLPGVHRRPVDVRGFHRRRTRVELVGVTEQLIGEPWLHARPFEYCGNIGPVAVSRGRDESARSPVGSRLMTGIRTSRRVRASISSLR